MYDVEVQPKERGERLFICDLESGIDHLAIQKGAVSGVRDEINHGSMLWLFTRFVCEILGKIIRVTFSLTRTMFTRARFGPPLYMNL